MVGIVRWIRSSQSWISITFLILIIPVFPTNGENTGSAGKDPRALDIITAFKLNAITGNDTDIASHLVTHPIVASDGSKLAFTINDTVIVAEYGKGIIRQKNLSGPAMKPVRLAHWNSVKDGVVFRMGIPEEMSRLGYVEAYLRYDVHNDKIDTLKILTDYYGTFLPALSPDGIHLAYHGSAYGIPEIWIANLETGEEVQVSDARALYPTWSHNGKYLYYGLRQDSDIEPWIFDLESGKKQRIADRAYSDIPSFSRADDYVCFISASDTITIVEIEDNSFHEVAIDIEVEPELHTYLRGLSI